jgi:hypothetical protein
MKYPELVVCERAGKFSLETKAASDLIIKIPEESKGELSSPFANDLRAG